MADQTQEFYDAGDPKCQRVARGYQINHQSTPPPQWLTKEVRLWKKAKRGEHVPVVAPTSLDYEENYTPESR
jgi:hypothetical protein